MNEALTLVLAWVGGGLVDGCHFLRRPLLDNSERRIVQTAGAMVLRQPGAADRASPWRAFTSPVGDIGSGCWCVSLDLLLHAWSVTWLTRPPGENDTRPAGETTHAP